MTIGTCPICTKATYLIPLHGEQGGPLMCPICVGVQNATQTRRRKFGHLAAKMIRLYIENGGKASDIIELAQVIPVCLIGLGIPKDEAPALLRAAGDVAAGLGELTAELLADTLQLTHPDRHPSERQELAKRVTQELLALQPFVLPAPKPEPAHAPPRNGSVDVGRRAPKEPLQPRYPCELCADLQPRFYCDRCKAEWDRRQQHAGVERRSWWSARLAKQREQYANRQRRKKARRGPIMCAAGCGIEVQSKRKDSRYCSAACRQRAYRQRAHRARQG
jgi:hypothetical protein